MPSGSADRLLLALALACACSGDRGAEADRAAPVVRDSADVTIVENAPAPPEARGGWRLSPEPTLSLGAVEGERPHEFFRALSSLGLSDGRIAVADAGTREIRLFDAEGRHLASYGGEGEGPGEFRALIRIHRGPGDTLVAGDPVAARISFFSPESGFVRSVPLPPVAGRPAARLHGVLDDGSLVLGASVRGGTVTRTVTLRDTLHVVRYDPSAERLDDLDALPGRERFWYLDSPAGPAAFPRPFGRDAHAVARGDRVLLGETGRAEIRVHGAGGLERLVRFGSVGASVDAEAVARYKEHHLASASAEETRRLFGAFHEVADFPKAMPAWAGLLFDAAGHVWVARYAPPWSTAPALWDVLDPGGARVATVAVPGELEMHDIGEDYVLGRVVDDLGVERIVRHDLFRGG